MREIKNRRRFRERPTRLGSDLISKEVIDFDTCETLVTFGVAPQYWRMRHEDSPAVYRDDPFGVHDYNVDYSLNKKRRWMMKDELGDMVEQVQDAYLNIRVSASIHAVDRSDLMDEPDIVRDRFPCLEYHTVSREGLTATHKSSKNGRARLRNFTHAAQPCRRQGKNRRARYVEREDWTGRTLDSEDNVTYQKLHVHYTVQQHSTNPSLHNKMANKGKRGHRTTVEIDEYYDDDEEPVKIERAPKRKVVEIPELIDDDVIYEDNEDNFIYEEDTGVPFSGWTVVEDLCSLVVRKEKRTRRGKKVSRQRFVDESLSKSFYVSTVIRRNEEIEDNLDEDESTASSSTPSIQLVSLPSEMPIRLSLSSLPNLHSALRLPCFPPAWEIHQKDSVHVLGEKLSTRVIARQYGEEMRLHPVDDCTSDRPSRLLLPSSDDIPPEIQFVSGDFCEICCGEMNLKSGDRFTHPFALSCSHLYCTNCWLSHISESIHQQKLPAACLHPSCSNTVSVSASKGLLSSSSVEIYEMAMINALKASEKLITCPGCKRLHFKTGSLRISCPCGTFLCSHCSSIDHSPLGCDVFDQYNDYLRRSGFTSIYSTSSEIPIIRDLAECPKCKALMQRTGGCNMMRCACDIEFCFRCGNLWTHSHYSCTKEVSTKRTMIDVSTIRQSPLLVPSLLTKAIEARIVLIDRRKELRKRLQPLPYIERKRIERIFLSLLLEFCYLSSRRSRKVKDLAGRLRFSLDIFYSTNDNGWEVKTRPLEDLRDSLVI